VCPSVETASQPNLRAANRPIERSREPDYFTIYSPNEMNPERRKELAASLSEQLDEESARSGGNRLAKLSELLHEYILRWSGFAAIQGVQLSSLMDSDFFGMIEIAVEFMEQELKTPGTATPNELLQRWEGFRAEMDAFRTNVTKEGVSQMLDTYSRFKSVLLK
jgi:hypothetical protein